MNSYQRRKLISRAMVTLTVLCAGAVILALAVILTYVAAKGISAINFDFFTKLPKPVGEPGSGLANAIVGSLILMGIASGVGLSVGILAGIYLSEYGKGRLGKIIRFFTDVMSGMPSIVIGIFVYMLIVLPMRSFSALAGGIALGLIMIPIVTRVTEEMLKLVPASLREAALALGIPCWRTILSVVLPPARSGIITGVMLALARVGGETAPLLFTALNSRFWHSGIDQPIASLTVYIYTYSISPFNDWHALAWAAAFLLVVLVLVLSLAARFFAAQQQFR